MTECNVAAEYDGSAAPSGGWQLLPEAGGSAESPGSGGEEACRGVYFDHIRHLWRANWPEETIVVDRDTKRPLEVRRCTRTKGFSAKKFGFQQSKQMAIAHRKHMITSGIVRKVVYQPAAAAGEPKPGKKQAYSRKQAASNRSKAPAATETPAATPLPEAPLQPIPPVAPPPTLCHLPAAADASADLLLTSINSNSSSVAYDFTFL